MTLNETVVWLHRRARLDPVSAQRVIAAGGRAVRLAMVQNHGHGALFASQCAARELAIITEEHADGRHTRQ